MLPLDVELLDEVEELIPPLDVDVLLVVVAPPLLVVVAPLLEVVAPLDVELLDDVDELTGSVVTRPPPSGVPVPSPDPPVEDEVDEVPLLAVTEPPMEPVTRTLPSVSVAG